MSAVQNCALDWTIFESENTKQRQAILQLCDKDYIKAVRSVHGGKFPEMQVAISYKLQKYVDAHL